MKKLLSLVLVLTMICGMAVAAQAANIDISTNSGKINAGDEIIVTVTLDQDIPVEEGATMLQGKLEYDGSVLTFQEIMEKSSQLSDAAKHSREDSVVFHYQSGDSTAVGFTKGTLVKIKLKAVAELAADHVNAAMSFTAYVQNAQGKDVGDLTHTTSVNVLVCQEHTWDEGAVTTEPTCGKKGVKTYTCTFSGCGETKTEEVPATGKHTYEDGKCKVCGEKDPDYVVETVEAVTIKVKTDTVTGKPKVTWGKSENAVKYYIYRRVYKTGEYKKIGTAKGTGYLDESAEAGTKYTYYVVAVGESGVKSGKSNKTSSTCDLAQPVIKDSNDTATGKPKLSWKAVDGAVKYKIYRSTSKNSECEYLTATEDTSWIDTSAKAGTLYYYQVKAACENEDGNSARSAVENRRCDLAQPVIKDSSDAKTGKPKLSWKAVDGAVAYEIYRATSKNSECEYLTSTEDTSWIDTSAKAGKLYYYQVKAVCEVASADSALSKVENRRCDLPRPVVSISLKNGDPKLSWKTIDDAQEYEIYRATSKDGEYAKVKTTTKTSWTDTSAKAGKTYYYKVMAIHVNTSANSAYSAVDSIKAE